MYATFWRKLVASQNPPLVYRILRWALLVPSFFYRIAVALRNQLYDAMHQGSDLNCDLVILDEAHFLGDMDRGVVWEEVMTYLPVRINLLLLSATIGNRRRDLFPIQKGMQASRRMQKKRI